MAIVGVNIFKKNCCVNNFSDYISKSDEAMAFLILANNWDVWKEMAEDMIKNKTEVKIPMEKCVSKQRYHVEGTGRGYSWSSSGKEYYNQIYDRIDEDCLKNSKEFDKYFLDYMIIMEETRAEQKQSKKRKKTVHPDSEIKNVRCRNDFIDLDNIDIFEM